MNQSDRNTWIKRVFFLCFDSMAVIGAGVIALLLRFDLSIALIPSGYLSVLQRALPVLVITTILIFYIFRLYSSLWSYVGAMELLSIISASIIVTVVGFFEIFWLNEFNGYALPRSFYISFGFALGLFTFLSRFAFRGIKCLVSRGGFQGEGNANVLIVGAGDAGNTLIREIYNSKYLHKSIVGIIDDDPNKIGRYIQGSKILGGRECIVEKAKSLQVKEIIIAMPSATPKEIRDILDICKLTGCELKRVPGIYQLVNGDISVGKLKEVDVNDLLGRESIEVDLTSILDYVEDKVVMVTGGGGSIGSEICRQIASHTPKKLIILDIYENTTYEIQNELKKKFPDLDLVVLIASVRNTKRIDLIFNEYKPDIVYHAAAHKHVPLMEDSPNEAIKNNVLGTWKVVQAADHWGVKRFVMISTDKAVNPTNIMGASKRICEMIIQTYNNRSKTEFVAVRFGNVLGSNGSVIPLFKKQIATGGPVTVTHPDIVRYFMTIPEAVSLVLQAGAYAKGGEIFVLDMGEPVKIVDLAKNLILLSGHKPGIDMHIKFVGLRPGEKLYEELLLAEEGQQETRNKLIKIGKPIEIDEEKFLRQLNEIKDYVIEEPEDIRLHVQNIVSTYVIKQCV